MAARVCYMTSKELQQFSRSTGDEVRKVKPCACVNKCMNDLRIVFLIVR